MFKGIAFTQPNYLFLLLVIPVLAAWYIFYSRKRNNANLQFSSTAGFEGTPASIKKYLRHLLIVLRFLAIMLLIIALARPQSSLNRQDIRVEGIDIILAMDISGSMLARDFKPDRIEASKEMAMEFIDGRPNDRIGLVIFSGETFTQCPITTDHTILKNLFKDLKSGMIDDGTAIGDGLATAVSRLKSSKAISKVIILLTDGINNMGSLDPLSAAEIAKVYGMRIYTIGVGTTGMAPYPVQTPFGIQIQSIKTDLDEPLLTKIADITDGKYFRATNNEKLRQIYREIDRMEKSKIDVTEFRKKKEEYLYLALLAMIFLGTEIILRNTYIKNIP